MASLELCDKHNMVAYLEKSEGSEGFHQIIDFLTASHIKNALTECPTLYASHIEQFWQTVALSTTEDGVRGITATIDRKVKVFVSEASIRRHLKLEDSDSVSSLPTAEIFEQLALMGYEGNLFQQRRVRLKELDLDARISLVPLHVADQGRIDDTHISDQPKEQLGIFSVATALADAARRRQSVENVQTYIRRSRLVSTADVSMPVIGVVFCWLKAMDKEKKKHFAKESEPPKKIKKRVQIQISVDEELAKKVFEEEQANDPSVLRYHTLQNKPFSVAEVRKNMCMYLKNQEGIKLGSRKKSLARKRAKETLSEESAKKQKLEDDTEKEELQVYLNIVLR
ncbi:hypothetical protein Tco_0539402 [Tanacetum coccineum]